MPRIPPELRDALLRAGVAPGIVDQVGGDAARQPQELGAAPPPPAPGAAAGSSSSSSTAIDWRQASDYLVAELVRALRQQPGLPVRPPPQQAPTFYAEPFSFVVVCELDSSLAASAGPDRTFGVRWSSYLDAATGLNGNVAMDSAGNTGETIPEPWPRGYVGFVTRAETYVGQINSYLVANPVRQLRWSLLHNGTPVNGYQNTVPSCHAATVNFLWAGGGQTIMALPVRNQTACPIRVSPGDTMALQFSYLAAPPSAVSFAVCAIVEGYRVPMSGDGRTPAQFAGID